jgi:hypothetical protein
MTTFRPSPDITVSIARVKSASGRLRADLDQLGTLIGEAVTLCACLADEHARRCHASYP